MKYYIVTTVDYNDADYNIQENEMNSKEDFEKFKEKYAQLLAVVKENHGRVNYGEYYSGEDFMEMYKMFDEDFLYGFMEYFNYGEHGFHRIESIRFIEVSNEEVVF